MRPANLCKVYRIRHNTNFVLASTRCSRITSWNCATLHKNQCKQPSLVTADKYIQAKKTQIYVLEGRGGARRTRHKHAPGARQSTHGPGKRGHGNGKPESKTGISKTINQTEFYCTTTPESCAPQAAAAVKWRWSFPRLAQPTKMFLKQERKHESPSPQLSADKESSVTGHAHLSPSFHQPIISRYPYKEG